MNDNKKFEELLDKVQKMKKGNKIDLSLEEDLSIAIMNLISLEEHFFFTAMKTNKPDYLDMLNETRVIRKAMLARMIDKHEGETWCVSKHLLAATMRLLEVGTKYLSDDKKKEATEVFESAHKIYAMFWALRLKLIDMQGITKLPGDKLNVHDVNKDKGGVWQVEDIVNKLVDCCNE
ncbi:MAG: hypothetical protein UU22_C0016G0007 [Parcubacteria group bacterium GW2011_GWA2_40_8]|nr:MAG: hypothetical protein UT82_C0032G0007 [Parcubacteria group bacterium GW2011_GWB1_40_14]KKR78667.1 MAG: hypothetical protein UU22_C0016G0007 [Parcubacteria group bacterium GW2011_GWA2_40_8]